MSRKRGWVASHSPSFVAGSGGTAPVGPRVWVRPQPNGPAVAPAAVSPPRSASHRPASGLGKACLAAVLASAAAKPHNKPAAGSPQRGPRRGVYLPSPHKLLAGASHHVQAAADREHVPPAAPGAALARQPNITLQPRHAVSSAQVVSGKRPASKTWIRPDAWIPRPADAAQQTVRAARTEASADSLQLSAPAWPRDGVTQGISHQVPSSPPASKSWVRARAGPAATLERQTAASQTAEALVGAARTAVQLPQVAVPGSRVWRRDDGADTRGTASLSGDARASAAVVGHAQDSRIRGGDPPVPAGRPQPARPASGKRSNVTSQPSRNGSAVAVAQRPRSLAWRNPELTSAVRKPAGSALTAAAAAQTAASAGTATSPAQRITARAPAAAARRLAVRSASTGGQLPGARAAALGRVAEGRVGKKLRSNKLQRIGDHLYRAQTGTGGHTLQRQGATPTVTARPLRPGIRIVTRFAPAKAAPSASGRGNASSAPRAKRSVSGRRPGKPVEPTIYCPSFCRTGKCPRRAEGRCKYVHDDSKVAVCPGWLAGQCRDAACPLQHAHAPALMPVCSFFLQGLCSNTQCPYLHVNLDPSAPVCEAFLRGYCAAGAACRSKHLTKRMVRDLRAKRTFVAAPAGERAEKKPKVQRPKRYFTDASMDMPSPLDDSDSLEDEDSIDAKQGDVPASPPAEAGSSSRWPEFIHLPENTDSE